MTTKKTHHGMVRETIGGEGDVRRLRARHIVH